jgi:hypothetical protein
MLLNGVGGAKLSGLNSPGENCGSSRQVYNKIASELEAVADFLVAPLFPDVLNKIVDAAFS